MSMRLAVLAGLFALAASIILLPTGRVSAHEHRAVGNYEFVVGFLNEPALAYEPNGLSLRISFFENGVPAEEEEGAEEVRGVPVEGLEEALQAEVIVGGGADTRELTLEPAFGDPGHYEAVFIPTLPGDYTYHIFGDVEGNMIDESFTSSPEGFDSVGDVSELQFPDQLPNNADLQASIDNLSTQVAALDTGGGGDSDTATMLAIVGIVVGALGLGAGGFALSRRS